MELKKQIIRVLVNAILGVVTSIATIYLGASAAEAIAVSGAVTGTLGAHATESVTSTFV